jgi:hypothetical protein
MLLSSGTSGDNYGSLWTNPLSGVMMLLCEKRCILIVPDMGEIPTENRSNHAFGEETRGEGEKGGRRG